jgi:hypothetical protein
MRLNTLTLVIAITLALMSSACSDSSDESKTDEVNEAQKTNSSEPNREQQFDTVSNDESAGEKQVFVPLPITFAASSNDFGEKVIPPVQEPLAKVDTHMKRHSIAIRDESSTKVVVTYTDSTGGQNKTRVLAQKSGQIFYVKHLPLRYGQNEFEIEHYQDDEVTKTSQVSVISSARFSPLIDVINDSTIGYNSLSSTFTIQTPLTLTISMQMEMVNLIMLVRSHPMNTCIKK